MLVIFYLLINEILQKCSICLFNHSIYDANLILQFPVRCEAYLWIRQLTIIIARIT